MKKTKRKPTAKDEKVLQLKITLAGSKPPIWRRVQVRESMHLGDLHRVVQIVMGWEDCHLHLFQVGGRSFSLFGDGDDAPVEEEDSRTVSLRALGLVRKGRKFSYIYDFGDDWLHQIEVEDTQPADPDVFYPVCVTGRKACPPEDCGGIWGYYNLLAAVKDSSHPEHVANREWLGEDFDPDLFDIAAVHHRLRATFKAMEPVAGLGDAFRA